MFKQTRLALATAAIVALAACSPKMQTATPVASTATVQLLFATPNTSDLVQDLLSHYADSSPDTTFVFDSAPYSQLVARTSQDDAVYFVSHHRPNDPNLWSAPLALDGIVAVVHPQNSIDNLTTSQFRQIYQGFIMNWVDVGGTANPITLYSRETGAAIREEFDRLVMGQRVTSPNAQIVPSTEASIQRVVQDINGIAYAPLSQLDSSIKVLSIDGIMPTTQTIGDQVYPLRSTIFIVGPEEPSAPLAAFVSWVQSEDGQATVSQKYIPLID
ncbi:MAG: hypothetical protein CL607_04665 [Anaerolineaceae bacterium]|nr:hypothetical protein [Anaerolineaceae bacterium]